MKAFANLTCAQAQSIVTKMSYIQKDVTQEGKEKIKRAYKCHVGGTINHKDRKSGGGPWPFDNKAHRPSLINSRRNHLIQGGVAENDSGETCSSLPRPIIPHMSTCLAKSEKPPDGGPAASSTYWARGRFGFSFVVINHRYTTSNARLSNDWYCTEQRPTGGPSP